MTASFGQDIFTRDEKEAIAKDLLRGDECQAKKTELENQIGSLKDQVSENEGIRVQLDGKIDDYKNVIVPAIIDERDTRKKELDIANNKLKTKNFWSVVKDVVIGGLIVELAVLSLK